MFGGWLTSRRRRRLLAAPVPEQWEATLRAMVRQYVHLPSELQKRVRQIAAVFVAEKDWAGAGIEITDDMKLAVAGHAGLLACGQSEPFFYDRLATIVVYPRTIRFSPEQTTRYSALPDFPAEGVAFQHGPVLLSWATVRRELAGRSPGRNVILHELAHHVDGLVDAMDGAPGVGDRPRVERWNEVTESEFLRLAGSARRREPTLLDHYGASNRAEFFAVSTECFFELPHALRRRHAELYDVLADFYRLDPAAWLPSVQESHVTDETPRRVHRRPHVSGQPQPGETHDAEVIAQRHAERRQAMDRARLRALESMSNADALYTLALGHLQARPPRAADAERILTALLAADPYDEEALAHRALARLLQDDQRGAEADCAAALAIDPADPDALEVRAELHCLAGRWHEAIADVSAALEEFASDVGLLTLRGDAYSGARQWSKAIADYSDALAIDPLDADALLGRADAWEAIGKSAKADRDRRRAQSLGATR
ncbi:MAG: zinc-dependent peptidase [Pirellulales bacterium]|nr:zinc-dependent peptidase [Pirellulales bacterium]